MQPGAHELVELHEAIVGGEDSGSAFCRAKLQLPAETLDPPPLVDGSDLIDHGIQPGPQFAGLLERLRDAQLAGDISDRQQALELVDRWLNESGNSP